MASVFFSLALSDISIYFFFLLVPVIGRKFRKWRLPSAEYHAPTERNVRLPCNELAFLSVRKDLRSFPIHRAAHELIGGCCRALTNAKCQQEQVAANKYFSTRPTPTTTPPCGPFCHERNGRAAHVVFIEIGRTVTRQNEL